MEIKEITDYCEELAGNVALGGYYALSALAILNDMAHVIAKAQEQVKEYAIKEAETYNENKFTFAGRTFTKVPARQMVKFDHVPQWKELAERRKRIEQLSLQAAKTFGVTIVDDETGEVIEPAQISYTKPSISVK